MKEYHVHALYTISVDMTIEAESYEKAMEIAEENNYVIDTEWTGNSVFVRESDMADGTMEMTLSADGTLRNFSCEDYDDEDEDDEEEEDEE